MSVAPADAPRLFNGAVESAVRLLLILDAFHPRRLDLDELALYDYFVVHTSDVGGPESLHPALSSRHAEYRVRRRTIEEGLEVVRHLHLVEVVKDDLGVSFEAGEGAPAVIGFMRSEYNKALRDRALWLAEQGAAKGHENFHGELRGAIERWTVEFHHDVDPGVL